MLRIVLRDDQRRGRVTAGCERKDLPGISPAARIRHSAFHVPDSAFRLRALAAHYPERSFLQTFSEKETAQSPRGKWKRRQY